MWVLYEYAFNIYIHCFWSLFSISSCWWVLLSMLTQTFLIINEIWYIIWCCVIFSNNFFHRIHSQQFLNSITIPSEYSLIFILGDIIRWYSNFKFIFYRLTISHIISSSLQHNLQIWRGLFQTPAHFECCSYCFRTNWGTIFTHKNVQKLILIIVL